MATAALAASAIADIGSLACAEKAKANNAAVNKVVFIWVLLQEMFLFIV
jgi:hypothetical protein